MSLPPEKNLATEENENTTETAKNNKRLVIGLITGLIVLFFTIILIYNNKASNFQVTKNSPFIKDQYNIIITIKRDRPLTFVALIYDKIEKQYFIDVDNISDQPIKFYPSSFTIIWPNGSISTASTKEEDLIPPRSSKEYTVNKYITSMPKTIMYYPKDNVKKGITVNLTE